mmetsp:Transcript_19438/g.22640  ORF Transcript_19438/g.22640 Transcript_19438/m.22640 type:complete len:125 (-) Transcript_19438:834-1208(-)
MNKVIDDHYMNIVVTNGYFDFYDYKTPIKTYMLDQNFATLNSTVCHYMKLTIKKNIAIFNDDILLGSQGHSTQDTFFSIEDKMVRTSCFWCSQLLIYVEDTTARAKLTLWSTSQPTRRSTRTSE